jgi:hypothetical protein
MRTREVKIRERKTDSFMRSRVQNASKIAEQTTPHDFICFDTEDDSETRSLDRRRGKNVSMFDKKVTQICAIAANGESFYNTGDVQAFLTWLRRRKERYIYALNIQYDLGNLFADVLDDLDCTLVGNRMIKAAWGEPDTDTYKIFVDVYNIWQCSVAKLGDVFELEKLETSSMESDKAYVFRDTEIIRQAMLYAWNFAEQMGLEYVPPTMGSFGVNLWKHWNGKTIHHSHELTRQAIFGGRVELFKTEDESGDVRYCDINSLYPSQMCKAFPGELEPTGETMLKYGIARVSVKVPKAEIMVLPFRSEEGKIYYPYGEFTGVWTIEEIRAAEARGAEILKVHECLSTDETVYPYRDYMTRIYEIRKNSKSDVEKQLFKLAMNSLFGRTGTEGKISRTIRRTIENEDQGTPFGKRVLIEYAMPLGEEVNWSHCAYITAYGRLELLKYLEAVGAKNLIYCDTDSVIFDVAGGKIPFHTGKELGEMKIEKMCSVCCKGWHSDKPCPNSTALENWGSIKTFAPKMYKIGKQLRAKGVPRKIPCPRCHGDKAGCAHCDKGKIDGQKHYVETGSARFDQPFKFREAAVWFDRGNKKKLSVWREIEKHNNANYDKKKKVKNRFFPLRISALSQ